MNKLNLEVNVPFIIEQTNPGNQQKRQAYVVLKELNKTSEFSSRYMYRLANLTQGTLKPPAFRTIQDVELYINAHIGWKVIPEDIAYGFNIDKSEERSER